MQEEELYTILNVDDSEGGRYSTTRILVNAGFRVFEASTGSQALAQLDEVSPDLVLLDINLPDMSGFEVCREIKDRAGDTIPVLHVSATYVMSSEWLESGGADGFLVQPVEPAALVGNVRALLRARDAERALARRERELRELAEALEHPVVLLDQDLILRFANSAFQHLPAAPAPGTILELRGVDSDRPINPEDLLAIARSDERCEVTLTGLGDIVFTVRSPDGPRGPEGFILVARKDR
jgi:CheY-like chemotaxis protein